MKISLKVDELTNRILSVEESTSLIEDIIVDKEEWEQFNNIDYKTTALHYENGRIIEKERNFNDFTEQMEALTCSIKELEEIDYDNVIVKSLLAGKSIVEAKRDCCQLDERKIDMRKKLAQMSRQYEMICKHKIKEEQVNKSYKYYCSVCLIIRNDNEYLEEWLNWHIKQGLQHFYIYDHGSKIPIAESVKSFSEEVQSKLTIYDFSGRHTFAQHEAYNDCLKRHGSESRWMAFIDSDEMIRVKSGKPLTEFLKDYEDYAGLFMAWIVYGANGHRNKSNEPCRMRFTSISPTDASANIGKVIVQPEYMRYMLTHNGYTKDGFLVVDEHKFPVDSAQPCKFDATTDLICVDHYYTKSYEEWLNKIKRGSCDPYYSRKYDEFFEYNPDMEYCRENTYPVQEYEISKI